MKKNLIRCVVLFAIGISLRASESAELDKIYEMRTFVSVVLGGDKTPVYTENLENESVRFFRKQSRFSYSDEGYVWLKDRIKTGPPVDPKATLEDQVKSLKAVITELQPIGVDAVIFTELVQIGERYKVVQVMVSTNSLEFIEKRETFVDDRYSLQSFTDALIEGLNELVGTVPFDGTVLRRDGFRVVLDRGTPDLKVDQQMSVYTLEALDGKLLLDETGLIKITEVGESYAFGKIMVENKPAEIETLNKISLVARPTTENPATRAELMANMVRQFGYFELQGSGSLVTVNNIGPSGGSSTNNNFFPGGSLRGQFWLTNQINFDVGFDFAIASLSADGSPIVLNSSIGDLRGQFSYRFKISDTKRGPFLELRAGYLRHQFRVDTSSDPVAFTSATYAGLLVGGGAGLPLFDKFEMHFDVNALALSTLTEGPLSSGSPENVTGWDFAIRAFYRFNESMDLLAKLQFRAFGADFNGIGERTIAVASSSESSKAFSLGVSFYF